MSEKVTQRCKFCRKPVLSGAKVCAYCGHYQKGWEWFIHRVLLSLIGPLLAILIFWGTISLDRNYRQEEEAKRSELAVLALHTELTENAKTIKSIRSLVEESLEAIKGERVVVVPLPHLQFDAWSYARFGPIDVRRKLKSETREYTVLKNCYSQLRLLDEKVTNREQWRVTGSGQVRYHLGGLEKLDFDLLKSLERAEDSIHVAQLYITSVTKAISTRTPFSEDPLFLNNYAWHLVHDQGDALGARPLIERALAVSPDEPNYLDTYGYVLLKKGKREEAIKYFKMALAQEDLPYGVKLEVQEHLREAERIE